MLRYAVDTTGLEFDENWGNHALGHCTVMFAVPQCTIMGQSEETYSVWHWLAIWVSWLVFYEHVTMCGNEGRDASLFLPVTPIPSVLCHFLPHCPWCLTVFTFFSLSSTYCLFPWVQHIKNNRCSHSDGISVMTTVWWELEDALFSERLLCCYLSLLVTTGVPSQRRAISSPDNINSSVCMGSLYMAACQGKIFATTKEKIRNKINQSSPWTWDLTLDQIMQKCSAQRKSTFHTRDIQSTNLHSACIHMRQLCLYFRRESVLQRVCRETPSLQGFCFTSTILFILPPSFLPLPLSNTPLESTVHLNIMKLRLCQTFFIMKSNIQSTHCIVQNAHRFHRTVAVIVITKSDTNTSILNTFKESKSVLLPQYLYATHTVSQFEREKHETCSSMKC